MGLGRLLKLGTALIGATTLFAYLYSTSPEPPRRNQLHDVQNELASNAMILSQEDLKDIRSFSDNSIYFSHAHPEIKEGTIIVSDISSEVKDGMLKKVIGTSSDGKEAYIQNATLEDVLKNASVELDVAPPSGPYTITIFGQTLQRNHQHGSLNVGESANFVIDLDGNEYTRADKINVSTSWKLHSDFKLSCEIENHELKELAFRNLSEAGYKIDVSCLESLNDFEYNGTIAEYDFPSYVVWISLGASPPLPVVIKPKLDVGFKLKGHVSPVKAFVQQDANLNVGLVYRNPSGWSIEKKFTNTFNYKLPNVPEVSGVVGGVTNRLSLLLYGIAGPYGSLGGNLGIDASIKKGKITSGLEAHLGINSKVFKEKFENMQKEIFRTEKIIYEWGEEKKEAKRNDTLVKENLEGKIAFVWVKDHAMNVRQASDAMWVCTMSLDGKEKRQVINGGSISCWPRNPSLSPDGKKIVFSDFGNGIYIVNEDGSGLKKLSGDMGTGTIFSLDGKEICYSDSRNGSVYSINLERLNQTFMFKEDYEIRMNWFPDGKKVIYSIDHKGGYKIKVANADGSKQKKIISGSRSYVSAPSVFPDGEHITYEARDKCSNSNIFIANVNGRKVKNLTCPRNKNEFCPFPTKDGKKIIFRSGDDANIEFYSMNIDGSDVKLIGTFP